jgi:hypothetical protein
VNRRDATRTFCDIKPWTYVHGYNQPSRCDEEKNYASTMSTFVWIRDLGIRAGK